MSRISNKSWKRTYEKTVETKFAETHWTVYEKYRLSEVIGSRYIWAPEVDSGVSIKVREYVDPLAPAHAGLFLEFARWFDSHKMDKAGKGKSLDTPQNAKAALSWTHEYGVLGLGSSPSESFAVLGVLSPSDSTTIAAEQLGAPSLAPLANRRAFSKGRRGGKHETIAGFVAEAYEANVVLRLYEAATAPTADIASIARFMSKEPDSTIDLRPAEYKKYAKSERERYSEDADEARSWALAIVEDAVNRKIESDVYPILLGEPGSYKEGWGFKSLLGAMWFQMRNYMLGQDNRCPECGQIFHRSRRDKTYCSDQCGGRARAARAYVRKKRREEEIREATRSKLRSKR